MATHSSILVWEIPWTEEPKESDMTEQVNTTTLNSTNLVIGLQSESNGMGKE